jgi:hypothetical protein
MKLDELKSQHPYVSFLFDLTGTLGYIASAGYAIPKLWLWFIAPITHLPAIGMVQALGLVIALSALNVRKIPALVEIREEIEAKKTETLIEHFARSHMHAIIYLLLLLVGWIYHYFL